MAESFVDMLAEGKPNTLGRTVEVAEIVMKDKSKLQELYDSYFQENEWVRLRASNAFKRVFRENPAWFEPWIDGFITEVAKIDQPSTQWTLAQLCLEGQKFMSDEQIQKATTVFEKNLKETDDWIVLNATMKTLGTWAKNDEGLKKRLIPELKRLLKDPHNSVVRTAEKNLALLS